MQRNEMIKPNSSLDVPEGAAPAAGEAPPTATGGWDPFEIWRSRIHQPRLLTGPPGAGPRSRARRRRQKS